jgi:hypothetical protein
MSGSDEQRTEAAAAAEAVRGEAVDAKPTGTPNASLVEDEPWTPAWPKWLEKRYAKLPGSVLEWIEDPDFSIYFVGFLAIAALIFLRPPFSPGKFVFDEQEAILANPYVRNLQGKIGWLDAFKRDFWGLLPDRSIGSYRPIPNLIWRALWKLTSIRGNSGSTTTFVWINVVFHAINASMLASWVRDTLRRPVVGWIVGATFCTAAIITEAVTGIVGIADCLGATSLLFCLFALQLRWELVGPTVFASTLIGLLCKETAIVNVGLVPLAALCMAPAFDKERPLAKAMVKASFAVVGGLLAIGAYFVVRHHTYHLDLPLDTTLEKTGPIGWVRAHLDHYVGAPNLPVDPFNNPLAAVDAPASLRIGGGLRVYARGVGQLFFPRALSPDYSQPQEPLPTSLWFSESIVGALLFVVPPLVGLWLVVRGWRARTALHTLGASGYRGTEKVASNETAPRFGGDAALAGMCLIAWPAAFFPVSNIPKALPTVRAERFWYTPALFIAVAVALFVLWLARRNWNVAALIILTFVVGQGVRARLHANDFADDLSFWEAAARAVPNNAKAHLNYSVMLGARGNELRGMTTQQAQEARLVENIRATELAPRWDMAFIYVGDTLCQLNRMDEAWDWYVKGMRIGSNNSGLIALALQCMSDKNALIGKEQVARSLVASHEFDGTWAQYLVRDTLDRERKCRGLDRTLEAESPEPDEVLPPVPWGEVDDEESASASASVSASARGSSSASASASARASSSAFGSALGGPSASASGRASANPSASASVSANASASGASSAHAAAKPPVVSTPLPPCGVDPKYRPRGLDGEPKSE